MSFPQHDGSPPDAKVSFPVPPDPAIGTVRSAWSNAPLQQGGVGGFFRKMFGTIECSYVGTDGVQRCVNGVNTVVRFQDIDGLAVSRTRIMHGSSYVHTSHKLEFKAPPGPTGTIADDKPLFLIDTISVDGVAPGPPAQFGYAAEKAWEAWFIPRVLDRYQREGTFDFRDGNFVVRVSTDALSAGYPGKVFRTRPRRELQRLWIERGVLYADPPLGQHAEVSRASGTNFTALIELLARAGYPIR